MNEQTLNKISEADFYCDTSGRFKNGKVKFIVVLNPKASNVSLTKLQKKQLYTQQEKEDLCKKVSIDVCVRTETPLEWLRRIAEVERINNCVTDEQYQEVALCLCKIKKILVHKESCSNE